MGTLMRWVKYSSPIVKMAMAISVTTAVVLGVKWFYNPYVRRSRLQQAEEWADFLIEQEERSTKYDSS